MWHLEGPWRPYLNRQDKREQRTNGEMGVFDGSHLLNFGVFRELRDVEYFSRFAVIYGTATWPNEQDICLDTLYQEAVLGETGSRSETLEN